MNTTHIAASTSLTMNCEHCRMTQSTIPGATLDRLADSVRGFLIMHRRCEKPVEPTKQVALFDDDKPHVCCCGARFAETWERATHWKTCAKFLGTFIDGNSDDPDPETDPPGPSYCLTCGEDFGEPGRAGHECEHNKPALTDQDDPFGKAYPMARDHLRLRHDLQVALQGPAPTKERLEAYPVGSPEFDTIAQWCRVQLATMNRSEHPELECYLPATPQPMPRVLRALLKPKRGTRPFSQPKKRRKANDAQP